MNWGKSITVVMITFITFIVVLVTIIMSNRIDLVSEDYYQKEIVFEDEIQAKNSWNKVSKDATFQSNAEHLIVNLPEIEGVDAYELILSRPNDNKKDISFKIKNTQTYLIEKSKLEKGVYDYRIVCQKDGKELVNVGKHYVK
jgi:hypothetical protein